jgi:hypothetical protein
LEVEVLDTLDAGQASEVGLVNQGRALQSVIGAFGLQMVVSEAPQLFVDERRESA